MLTPHKDVSTSRFQQGKYFILTVNSSIAGNYMGKDAGERIKPKEAVGMCAEPKFLFVVDAHGHDRGLDCGCGKAIGMKPQFSSGDDLVQTDEPVAGAGPDITCLVQAETVDNGIPGYSCLCGIVGDKAGGRVHQINTVIGA